MFYSVFATLSALVSICNTTANGNSFFKIERRLNSDNSVSNVYMQHNANVLSFNYDNSNSLHYALRLTDSKDRVYTFSDLNDSYTSYLEWYVYRINNGEQCYFAFDSYNSEGLFNLKAYLSFDILYDHDVVATESYEIDYSSNEFLNTYSVRSTTVYEDFVMENMLTGLIEVDVTIVYAPMSESAFNANGSYNVGYDDGYTQGYDTGFGDGTDKGYQSGYSNGYTEGANQDATATAIFSGIIEIALVPINFFLACLNFEVFGINIGAFVSALLTAAIVVILMRVVLGGNGGGSDGK